MNTILLLSISVSSFHSHNSLYFPHNPLYPMASFFFHQISWQYWSVWFIAMVTQFLCLIQALTITLWLSTKQFWKGQKKLQYSIVSGMSNNLSVLYRYIWGQLFWGKVQWLLSVVSINCCYVVFLSPMWGCNKLWGYSTNLFSSWSFTLL